MYAVNGRMNHIFGDITKATEIKIIPIERIKNPIPGTIKVRVVIYEKNDTNVATIPPINIRAEDLFKFLGDFR